MAVDKLVDSTQLDSDLTSVANAIRTKGGTSADLAFPSGFVSAVEAIPTGGGSDFTFPADVVRQVVFKKSSDSEINVDFTKFPNLGTLSGAFNGNTNDINWSKITIKPPSTAMDTSRMFYCSSSAGENSTTQIVIDGILRLQNTSNAGFCGNRKGLVTITGYIDLTGVTIDSFYNANNYTNGFYSCNALETVSFVQGTMVRTSTNWNMSWCPLSKESLISLANALKDTYSGTITLKSTSKAMLSSIMGTVTTSDGLSIFTESASGTVTLENFLTQTKGATIA